MLIFFIGMAEMVIATLWTKFVSETRIVPSTTITIVNVLVWYYVLRVVIDNINNVSIILLYALGCGLGTMLSLLIPRFVKTKTTRTRKTVGTITSPHVPAMPTLTRHDAR